MDAAVPFERRAEMLRLPTLTEVVDVVPAGAPERGDAPLPAAMADPAPTLAGAVADVADDGGAPHDAPPPEVRLAVAPAAAAAPDDAAPPAPPVDPAAVAAQVVAALAPQIEAMVEARLRTALSGLPDLLLARTRATLADEVRARVEREVRAALAPPRSPGSK